MELLKIDSGALSVSSLFDLCEILAEGSGGVQHADGYNAYFVQRPFGITV